MVSGAVNKSTWITIKEASDISGRSVNAIRLLIHRGKIGKIKKVKGKGRGEWLVHRDSLSQIIDSDITGEMSEISADVSSDRSDNLTTRDHSPDITTQTYNDHSKPMIPLEYYDSRRDEWMLERDRLLQGLMMYRYKFEELDRQLKMLPAPPEFVKAKLDELEHHLQKKEELASQYEEKITQVTREKENLDTEYEQAKAGYEEYLTQFREKLQQEERQQTELKTALEVAAAELTRLRRPWWKKLLGTR